MPVIEGGQGGSLVTRETSRGGKPFTAPVISTVNSWGQGQACGKVSLVRRVQGKQALRIYRQQENSQLEWSDYSLHSIPCRTLTILAGLSFAISLVSLQPGNTNTTLLYFQGCRVCPSAILYFSSCGSVFGILKFPVIMKRSFYPIAISKR